MLDRILHIVAAEGAGSVAGLARRLDVSEELVEVMLEALAEQGYLKGFAMGCRASCPRCPLHTACLFAGQQRLWMLTRKGEALLARR